METRKAPAAAFAKISSAPSANLFPPQRYAIRQFIFVYILVTPGGASSCSIPKVTQLSHFYADELFRCVFVD